MKNTKYFLYRLILVPKKDGALFRMPNEKKQILTSAVEERGSFAFRRPKVWRIGKIWKVDLKKHSALGFHFGWVSDQAEHNTFNNEIGDFDREQFLDANYTQVLFDFEKELCGVAHNMRLGSDINRITSNLARVINKSETLMTGGYQVAFKQISETDDFFRKIDELGDLVRFEISIERPNPMDVENLLHIRMREAVSELNGETARLKFEGTELDKELAKEMMSSTAATGAPPKARVRDKKNGKIHFLDSSTDHAFIEEVVGDHKNSDENLIAALHAKYDKVKSNG